MGKAHHSVEVAKTVFEVAEVAFSAVEKIHHLHGHNHDHGSESESGSGKCCVSEEELEEIKAENRRLRELLEENLRVLERISASGGVEGECPSDLHKQLVSTVESERFLKQLQSLLNEFPFRNPTATDLDAAEVLANVDQEEPSWWVWITKEMVPGTVEERSGIDDESYVIVCEEHVVDGVSNFIARCILSNPKALKLTPEQLQKLVANSVSGINKFEKMLNIWEAGKLFYALFTWGLALAGLYRNRRVIKFAAKDIHTTGKLVLKAL